jgi:cytochrome c-type biogenesis protein CcmH/NrfG
MAQHSNMLQQLLLARRFTKEIDRALQLDPRDIQALRDQLEYYLLAPGIVGGDKSRARAMATRIARIDPAEGLAAQARIASFDKDEAGSLDLLRKAVAANPAKYKIWIALARAGQTANHPDQAQAAAERAVQLDPSRADAYSILAGVLARQGQVAALDAILQQADHAVPDDLTPHYRAAEAFLANGHGADAVRQLDIYLSQEPEGGEPEAADARRLRASVASRTKAQEHVPN